MNFVMYIIFLSFFALKGNVYIADQYNHRVRKVTISTSLITTIAGTGATVANPHGGIAGYGSYSGDNGAATSATLNFLYEVALDTSGSSIISSLSMNIVFSCFSLLAKVTCTSLILIIIVSAR